MKAYRAEALEGRGEAGAERPAARRPVLGPALKRSGRALLPAVPRACGGCRTRWSCATIALEWQARRGLVVSAETVRRGLQALDWEWQRAQLGATDNDPPRVAKRARMRLAGEQRRAGAALFFADEVDMSLLPTVGYPGLPTGTPVAVMTPGTTEKRSWAGALPIGTGPTQHWGW